MGRSVADAADLERRVKDMYTRVAREPQARYHFAIGRAMTSRLGHTDEELDAAPAASIESFAGTSLDQEAFHADLVALWSAQNRSGGANRTVVDSEYLQVVAIRWKE